MKIHHQPNPGPAQTVQGAAASAVATEELNMVRPIGRCPSAALADDASSLRSGPPPRIRRRE
ncbi:hypothetical protein LLS1_07460 [Leifsonia sp. LS1]|nr:hypothetical protein LLS1_07460 [Leifsonia sp. LS1]